MANDNQIAGINPDNAPALPRGPPGREFNVIDAINARGIDHLMKLWEVDKRLTVQGRMDIINFYTGLSSSMLMCGWGAFFAVGSIPFLIQYKRTGSTRGARAGLGILGALGGMMAGSNVGLRRGYQKQMSALEQDPSKADVLAMVRLVSPMEMPMWMRYFQETSKDESKRMPDPRVVVQQLKDEGIELNPGFLGRTRDPLGLHPRQPRPAMALPSIAAQAQAQNGPVFAAETDDPFAAPVVTTTPSLSSWDAVRVQSAKAQISGLPPAPGPQPAQPLVFEEPNSLSTESFESLVEQERAYGLAEGRDDGDKWA